MLEFCIIIMNTSLTEGLMSTLWSNDLATLRPDVGKHQAEDNTLNYTDQGRKLV